MYSRLSVLALAIALIAACDDNKKPAVSANQANAAPTSSTTTTNSATTSSSTDASESLTNVNISKAIRDACGISDNESFFAFDSATVRNSDVNTLSVIATCFSKGKLAGKSAKLVGHAYPRGGDDYNMTLAQSRADSVAHYLVGHGMTQNSVSTTSRGALDSTGQNEVGWAKDRRVDILLAN